MPELTLESLGESDDLTDRERLALAFGILREAGWFAPVEWSTTLCCTHHGWIQTVEHFGMTKEQWMGTAFEDEPPSIWWHMSSDSSAFYGTMTETPMSEAMENRIDAVFDGFMADENIEDPESATAQWMEDHQAELDMDETIQRTTVLVDLVADLGLHWSGGLARMQEAVDVLRSVGLVVSEAGSPNNQILVHPNTCAVRMRRRTADGRIAVWLGLDAHDADMPPIAVLSHEDARRVIEMLRAELET